MTFETIDAILDEPVMSIRAEQTEPAPSFKQKIQPWLKLLIGIVCLTQGLRFMLSSDAIGTMLGLGLLIPVPSCCYLGWRDYLRLKPVRAVGPVSAALRRAA